MTEVRSAYLALARRLHPDRWVDASPEERADAERRMQAVNEAWRVLGNPGRRVAYEASQRRYADPAPRPAGAGSGFSTGSLFEAEDLGPPGAAARIVRVLPWIVLALVLGGIFVFTAYATSDNGTPPEGSTSCIVRSGGSAEPASCDAPGARTVVAEVLEVGQCPAGTEPYQPADRNVALCLLP
jgi:curved DNA-binding protein CbpA